jgi:hypothetical protein
VGEVARRLGRVSPPAAGQDALVFQVPSGRSVRLAAVIVCNRHTAPVQAYLAVTGGGAPQPEDFIAWGVDVPANDTWVLPLNIPLPPGAALYGRSTATAVNFHAYGWEEI